MAADRRRMERLSQAESVRLLGSVASGRIVFTQRALLAIRPVNHVVVDEADSIDPDKRLGWSATVTGVDQQVTDPDDQARYAALLEPWIDRQMDYTVRIVPKIVTGYAMVDGTVDGDAADDDPVGGEDRP